MIDGECDARFARVRAVFAEELSAPDALGSAVAVTVGGRTVVSLWGGHRDKSRVTPWTRDTLVNVYSTTKGWTAACLLRLVSEGRVRLEDPVATHWPEFAQADKGGVTVGMLLDHSAALPAVRETLEPEALFDWDAMTSALAAEAPWWPPGTRHGYHPFTFGWLVGEVIRRVSGVTPGRYFREVIAGPLALDAHIGMPASMDARCAELRAARRDPGAPATLFQRIMEDPTSMTARAFTNPISMVTPGVATSRAWRAAELPAVNGHATAEAVATLYGALAEGGARVGWGDGVMELARAERTRGDDAVLGVTTRFGAGYMLPQPGEMFGPNDRAFGHPGAGGSLGFADPEAAVGFGYVTNRMGVSILVDPRTRALIDAVYDALGG